MCFLYISDSFLEAWLISRHKAFNTTHQVYTAANGFTLDIGLTVHRDMFSIMLGIDRRLQSLKLNAEETYILQATVQLFPGKFLILLHVIMVQMVEILRTSVF